MRQNVSKLDDLINSNVQVDELLYLKIKCLLSEAYDYFGELKSSDDLLSEGSEILDRLKALKDVEPGKRIIIREQVRFCLNHAHAFLYREYRFREAKERVQWCRDFVNDMLRDEKDFPCFGTLAQAEFYLGRIYRRLNRYDEAEECFRRAIEYYYKRAKVKQEEYENDESKQEALQGELTFSKYKLAICLGIGLGWVSFARGHLRKGIYQNILPARVWLLGTGDKLNTAYLDLLFGSAKRSVGGRSDQQSILEAIRIIENAYKVFQEHNHVPYMAHAALELSLAYLYNREYYKAQSKLTELEAVLKEDDKPRWECPRLLVLSRISREMMNFREAERLASDALTHAEHTNQLPYQIEALIVRSGVRVELKEIERARADLAEALKLNKHGKKQANPKVEAVCQLHLARIYAMEQDRQEARGCFKRWKQLAHEIEHGIIHEIADDVDKDIKALSKDFVIPAGTEDLSYEYHLKALQKFLVSQAKQKSRTIQETTEKLKISRQTLHQWQKEKKV